MLFNAAAAHRTLGEACADAGRLDEAATRPPGHWTRRGRGTPKKKGCPDDARRRIIHSRGNNFAALFY
jgi:hypothetical protein